jgi:hypothetical protein
VFQVVACPWASGLVELVNGDLDDAGPGRLHETLAEVLL